MLIRILKRKGGNTIHPFRFGEMWDLNDSPDQRRDAVSEECSDEKGKRVESISNSSSSAMVLEDCSEEEYVDRGGVRKKSNKIFGFSVAHGCHDDDAEPCSSLVTRQFFPVDESEMATDGGPTGFPMAQWVGVKFCQSEPHGSGDAGGSGGAALFGKSAAEVTQPLKKSRRGPRSRSSQYRGVTFYRRTGRWESHIWYIRISYPSLHLSFDIYYYEFISRLKLLISSLSESGIAESKCI